MFWALIALLQSTNVFEDEHVQCIFRVLDDIWDAALSLVKLTQIDGGAHTVRT